MGRQMPTKAMADSAPTIILLKAWRMQAHKRHDYLHILRAHDLSHDRHRSSASGGVVSDVEMYETSSLVGENR